MQRNPGRSSKEALAAREKHSPARALSSLVKSGEGALERREHLTGRDLAEIVQLLECKLAWFGFRSVKLGPFIRVKDNTVSIDLLDGGEMLCRIEL
jgi:hypothetical protein